MKPGALMLFKLPQPDPLSAVAVYGAFKLTLWKPPLPTQKYKRRPSSMAVVPFNAEQPVTLARLVQTLATGSYFQKTPMLASTSYTFPVVGSYAVSAKLPFCAGLGAAPLTEICVQASVVGLKYHMPFEKLPQLAFEPLYSM